MFAYCLFCRTQRCARIAQLLEIKGLKRAFSPRLLQKHRKKGENQRKYVDMMPGYVFAFSEEQLTDYSVFFGIDGVIRKVGQAADWYELKGPDRKFAMDLLEKDGRVDEMKLVKNGDEVVIDDPLFADRRGTVRKIDYKKERAQVDFTFEGHGHSIWVALEEVTVKRN